MKLMPRALSLTLACLWLSLTGCETQPEDIAQWKAEGNTEKLIKVLKDPRQFMRLDAISALTELKAENAIEPLGGLVNDPDIVVVHESLDALAIIGTPAIEPYMLQAIAFKTEPARFTAAKSLGKLKSEKAVDLLITTLQDKFENIAVASAVSLGQIGDEKAIGALAKTALKGSVQMREASTAAIRQIDGPTSIEPLAAVLSDISIIVREEAVAGLIEAGDASEPFALKALNSENGYERESALSVLKGISKVPTTGKYAVWFNLSGLSVGEKLKIQCAEARKLAEIPDGLNALVDAASHPSKAIREHAFLALETVGEPAAEPLIAAAASTKSDALKWFNARSGWAGAPAWELDLWGAATALNPDFSIDKRSAKLLAEHEKSSRELLESGKFVPVRELIPLLIERMAGIESEDENVQDKAEQYRKLAFRKLRAYKTRSKLPLMAAVWDEDLQIAAHAAKILSGIEDDPRATQVVIDSFAKRIETGVPVTGTPFHDAMLELNNPDADVLLLKIRPNAAEAIRTAERKYPGVRISNIPVPPSDKVMLAEPFRLKCLVDGKTRELKVVFRPDGNGDWTPTPPLPDQLPAM